MINPTRVVHPATRCKPLNSRWIGLDHVVVHPRNLEHPVSGSFHSTSIRSTKPYPPWGCPTSTVLDEPVTIANRLRGQQGPRGLPPVDDLPNPSSTEPTTRSAGTRGQSYDSEFVAYLNIVRTFGDLGAGHHELIAQARRRWRSRAGSSTPHAATTCSPPAIVHAWAGCWSSPALRIRASRRCAPTPR